MTRISKLQWTGGLWLSLVLAVFVATPAAPQDTTPPQLTITAPTEGEIVDDSTTAIRLELGDPESGIDPESLRLTLDGPNAIGFDLTPTCVVEADGAVCEPPPLADGRYTLIATVSNQIGLTAAASHRFVLHATVGEIHDAESPKLAWVEPIGDPPPDVRSPRLRFDYSDTGTGVIRMSFELLLDERDITAMCTLDASSATCRPWPLAGGEHTLVARVLDLAGNPAEVKATLTITTTVVDGVRPSLSIVEPARGATLTDTTPTVVVAYADADSGIDRTSLNVQIGTRNITSDCEIGPDRAVCTSPPLAAGSRRVIASVDDLEGNGLLTRSDFEIVLDGADTMPPIVELLAPGTGPVLADLFETIVLGLDDDLTGVDRASVVVELDGRNISFDCAIAATTRCKVPFLGGGDVVLVVRLADIAGNLAEHRFDIAVIDRLPDHIPPTLVIEAPAASIGEGPFTVRLEYTDTGGSGIDRSSLMVTLDGQPLDCKIGAISARCPVDTLAAGSYRLNATLADQDGNTASVGLDVEVVANPDPPSIPPI